MDADAYKILLDQPSKEPALRFDIKARGLAAIIRDSDPRFAIGIFGDWGAGKTTLMQAIRDELDGSKAIPVEFSAWRYEREEHLIIPMLDTVREAIAMWADRPNTPAEPGRRTAATIGRVLRTLAAGFTLRAGVPGLEATFEATKVVELKATG